MIQMVCKLICIGTVVQSDHLLGTTDINSKKYQNQ